MENPTALITGASTGIGKEIARLCAAGGANLVLVARRKERLEQIAKTLAEELHVDAKVIDADLSKESACQTIMDRLSQWNVEIDVLINNAGFGTNGAFTTQDESSQLDMIRVNVTSLVELTHKLLPGMRQRGRGRILNVASTAAFQPGPRMATYYATKAFVLSFSEALYEELRGSGVTVTCLCPGPTDTEFADRANMKGKPLFKMGTLSAQHVAKVGYRAMQRGKPLVVTGFFNKLLAFSVRFAPRWLVRRVVSRIQ